MCYLKRNTITCKYVVQSGSHYNRNMAYYRVWRDFAVLIISVSAPIQPSVRRLDRRLNGREYRHHSVQTHCYSVSICCTYTCINGTPLFMLLSTFCVQFRLFQIFWCAGLVPRSYPMGCALYQISQAQCAGTTCHHADTECQHEGTT